MSMCQIGHAVAKHLQGICKTLQLGQWQAELRQACDAELSCQRAALQDGQSVLELGCGWGSMSLYMAARYPNSSVVAVSNSKTQKELIDRWAKERGLANLVRHDLPF